MRAGVEIMNIRAALIICSFALSGCHDDVATSIPSVEGIYTFNGCPDINITGRQIKIEDQTLFYEVKLIKGYIWIVPQKTIAVDLSDGCDISLRAFGGMVSFVQNDGPIRIEIGSLHGSSRYLFIRKR